MYCKRALILFKYYLQLYQKVFKNKQQATAAKKQIFSA